MTERTEQTAEGFRQTRFEAPPSATTILLVRHGESAPAVPGKPFPLKDGHGDPALHPNGELQAQAVGRRLSRERIDAIYTSSLIRTHQTAAPLVAALGLSPTEIHDLREVFLGEWEGGVLRAKAAANDPIYLRMRAERRWDLIPGAESSEVFSARLWNGLNQVVTGHPGGRVAVFCHGAVIGQVLGDVTGAHPFSFNGADNGSISEIVVDGPVRLLRRFNDISHLD